MGGASCSGMQSLEPDAVLHLARGLSGPSGCICERLRDGLREEVFGPVRSALRCTDSGASFLKTDSVGSSAS